MIELLYSLTLGFPFIFAIIIIINREVSKNFALLIPITPFILSILAFNKELSIIEIPGYSKNKI